MLIYSDTILEIYLNDNSTYYDITVGRKRVTIGAQYDFFSSTYGFKVSNGFDELPLIHFEDFSESIVFKLQANTNFNDDYSYGINVGFKNIHLFPFLAIEYIKYDYSKRDFQYQDINLSAKGYIKNTNIMLKLSYQNLNNNANLGADIGVEQTLIYSKLYCGISAGYYQDYFNYSGFIQSFIYKDIIGLSFNYIRIDTYDFLTLGISVTLRR